MDADRRRYLGLLAGALTGVAGCVGSDDGTPTDDTATDPDGATATPERHTPTPTATGILTDGSTPTGTPTPSLVLDPVEASSDAALTVYPTELASILREAATSEEPVRATADAFVYAPEPVLPTFDAVEVVDPVGDAGGVYEVDCQGGPAHTMYVKAEEVPAEETEDVTPVSELPDERRDLVLGAIDDERVTVSPETERGEWAREQFFGEYVSHEGVVYRGTETHATDAVFFSTSVWYVLSLMPVEDAEEPVTLRLPDIGPAVRTAVRAALGDWRKDHPLAATSPPGGESVREFAAETERLLINTHAFDVRVEVVEESDV